VCGFDDPVICLYEFCSLRLSTSLVQFILFSYMQPFKASRRRSQMLGNSPMTRVNKIIIKWSINGNISLFHKNFLTIRSIQVKAQNNLSNTLFKMASPKRKILSVTLFLITIHDIFLQILKPTKHNIC